MRLSKIVLIISGALYLLSLALPTVAEYNGIGSLFLGPLALIFAPKWGAVWLANIFFFIAIIRNFAFKKPPRINWLLIGIAIALASGSFFIEKVMINEGGGKAVAHLHSGFYVWLGAMLVLFGYNVYLAIKPVPGNQDQTETEN